MKSKEVWKKVVGYEDYYEVSNIGNVRSLDRVTIDTKGRRQTFKGRVIKPRKNFKGYYVVTLKAKGKKPLHIKNHQLVAMSFLGHTRCGHDIIVDHINEVKTDNRVENLQLITNSENIRKHYEYKKFCKYYGYTNETILAES